MAIIQRPGDFIPGIDSVTGETINLTLAEWQHRIRGLEIVRVANYLDLKDTIRVYDKDKKLLYEIYMDRLL
jgi:hypothetical protein